MKRLTLRLLMVLPFVIGKEAQELNEELKYASLVEWIHSSKGGLHAARIESVPGMGAGIIATRSVKIGELITSTPLTTVINIEHAWASNDFGTIAADLAYLSDINLKSLFVLYERLKPGSTWKPYLDALPSDIHTTLFFNEEELNALQSSMVKEFALKQQKAANKAYLKIKADLTSRHANVLPNLTREDFYWGLSLWSSRAHTIEVKDKDGHWERASCLVPLADLFNMAAQQEQVNVVCSTNEASTHFECRTSKPLVAGQQLLVSYGTDPATRHNGRLLMHYGFVVQENPLDSVSLKSPQLNEDLSDHAQRVKMSQKLTVLSNAFFQLSKPQDPFFTVKELLKAFRLIQGTASDVRAAELHGFVEPLNSEREKKVIRATINYLKKALASYETTVEEDKQMMNNDSSLSLNTRHAVLLRIEEKLIIAQNIAYLKGLLKPKIEL